MRTFLHRRGRELRYLAWLLWSVAGYTAVNRKVWPLLAVVLLLCIGFLTVATHTVAPFLYTLF
jgi:hypothetical protein